MAALALGALGVVYGDIGTSPLYALKECFTGRARRAADAGQRARRPLAHRLGADLRGHLQVPRLRHAGRQPRRGRHPRAHGAGRQQRDHPARPAGPARARALRRRAALRRRRHHAGHLACSARWRASRWPTPACAGGGADHGRSSWSGSSSSRGAAPARWARSSGPSCWSGSPASAARRLAHLREPRVLARRQPRPRASRSSSATAAHGFLVLGAVVLVVTGGEALYADMGHFGRRPIRLAWYSRGHAGADAQLLRAGGAAAPRTRRRSRTRSTGSCPAGRSTRWWSSPPPPPSWPRRPSSPAPSRSPTRRSSSATCRASPSGTPRSTEIGQIYVPEVNWALAVGTHRAGARLPLLQQPGRRLRHRRHRHDDHHHAALPPGGARPLGLAALGGLAAHRRLPGRRPLLPRRQPRQDRGGRLVPARRRAASSSPCSPPGSAGARCWPSIAARDRPCRSSSSCPTWSGTRPHRIPGHRGLHDLQPGTARPACCSTT